MIIRSILFWEQLQYQQPSFSRREELPNLQGALFSLSSVRAAYDRFPVVGRMADWRVPGGDTSPGYFTKLWCIEDFWWFTFFGNDDFPWLQRVICVRLKFLNVFHNSFMKESACSWYCRRHPHWDSILQEPRLQFLMSMRGFPSWGRSEHMWYRVYRDFWMLTWCPPQRLEGVVLFPFARILLKATDHEWKMTSHGWFEIIVPSWDIHFYT